MACVFVCVCVCACVCVCLCVCVCVCVTPKSFKSCTNCEVQLLRPTLCDRTMCLDVSAPRRRAFGKWVEGTGKHVAGGGGVRAPTASCIRYPCFCVSLCVCVCACVPRNPFKFALCVCVCVCAREEGTTVFTRSSRLDLYGHTSVLGSSHSPL